MRLPATQSFFAGLGAACALALLVLSVPGLAADREVKAAELVDKDGLVYFNGETAPFTGIERERDEAGTIRAERKFASGKAVEVRQFSKNGKPAAQTVISATGLTRKVWYDNGNLEEDTQVVSDRGVKVSEKSKLYYEDGKLKLEIGYLNGKPHGQIREYAPGGQIVRDETYDQGTLTRKAK